MSAFTPYPGAIQFEIERPDVPGPAIKHAIDIIFDEDGQELMARVVWLNPANNVWVTFFPQMRVEMMVDENVIEKLGGVPQMVQAIIDWLTNIVFKAVWPDTNTEQPSPYPENWDPQGRVWQTRQMLVQNYKVVVVNGQPQIVPK